MSERPWLRHTITVGGWGLVYLAIVAAVAASNALIGARPLAVATWSVGACILCAWSLRVAARSGAFGSPGGVLVNIATAIVATAFFAYCGFAIIVIVWEAVGLGH